MWNLLPSSLFRITSDADVGEFKKYQNMNFNLGINRFQFITTSIVLFFLLLFLFVSDTRGLLFKTHLTRYIFWKGFWTAYLSTGQTYHHKIFTECVVHWEQWEHETHCFCSGSDKIHFLFCLSIDLNHIFYRFCGAI